MLDFPSFLAGFLTGIVGIMGAQMWAESRMEKYPPPPMPEVVYPPTATLSELADEQAAVDEDLEVLSTLDAAVHGWLQRTQGEVPEL